MKRGNVLDHPNGFERYEIESLQKRRILLRIALDEGPVVGLPFFHVVHDGGDLHHASLNDG